MHAGPTRTNVNAAGQRRRKNTILAQGGGTIALVEPRHLSPVNGKGLNSLAVSTHNRRCPAVFVLSRVVFFLCFSVTVHPCLFHSRTVTLRPESWRREAVRIKKMEFIDEVCVRIGCVHVDVPLTPLFSSPNDQHSPISASS